MKITPHHNNFELKKKKVNITIHTFLNVSITYPFYSIIIQVIPIRRAILLLFLSVVMVFFN